MKNQNEYVPISREIFKDIEKGIISLEEGGLYMQLAVLKEKLPIKNILDWLDEHSIETREETEAILNSLIDKKIIKLIEKDGLQDIEFLKYVAEEE